MQPGVVKETYTDIAELQMDVGFNPTTNLDVGLSHFVDWYKKYHLKGN